MLKRPIGDFGVGYGNAMKRMRCSSEEEVHALQNLLSLKHLHHGDLSWSERDVVVTLSDTQSSFASTSDSALSMSNDASDGTDMRGTIWTGVEEENLLELIQTHRIVSPFTRKAWLNFAAAHKELLNGRSVESFYRRSLKMRNQIEVLLSTMEELRDEAPIAPASKKRRSVSRPIKSEDMEYSTPVDATVSPAVSGAKPRGEAALAGSIRAHSNWTSHEEKHLLRLIEKYRIELPYQRKGWDDFERVYGSHHLNGRSINAVCHRVEKMRDRVDVILRKISKHCASQAGRSSDWPGSDEAVDSCRIVVDMKRGKAELAVSRYPTSSASAPLPADEPSDAVPWTDDEDEALIEIILQRDLRYPFKESTWTDFLKQRGAGRSVNYRTPKELRARCLVLKERVLLALAGLSDSHVEVDVKPATRRGEASVPCVTARTAPPGRDTLTSRGEKRTLHNWTVEEETALIAIISEERIMEPYKKRTWDAMMSSKHDLPGLSGRSSKAMYNRCQLLKPRIDEVLLGLKDSSGADCGPKELGLRGDVTGAASQPRTRGRFIDAWSVDEEENLLRVILEHNIIDPFHKKTWDSFCAKEDAGVVYHRTAKALYNRCLMMKVRIRKAMIQAGWSGSGSLSDADGDHTGSAAELDLAVEEEESDCEDPDIEDSPGRLKPIAECADHGAGDVSKFHKATTTLTESR